MKYKDFYKHLFLTEQKNKSKKLIKEGNTSGQLTCGDIEIDNVLLEDIEFTIDDYDATYEEGGGDDWNEPRYDGQWIIENIKMHINWPEQVELERIMNDPDEEEAYKKLYSMFGTPETNNNNGDKLWNMLTDKSQKSIYNEIAEREGDRGSSREPDDPADFADGDRY
jgi:hypothetical protein